LCSQSLGKRTPVDTVSLVNRLLNCKLSVTVSEPCGDTSQVSGQLAVERCQRTMVPWRQQVVLSTSPELRCSGSAANSARLRINLLNGVNPVVFCRRRRSTLQSVRWTLGVQPTTSYLASENTTLPRSVAYSPTGHRTVHYTLQRSATERSPVAGRLAGWLDHTVRPTLDKAGTDALLPARPSSRLALRETKLSSPRRRPFHLAPLDA